MSRTIFVHSAPSRGTSVVVPVSERPVALDELYQEFSAPLAERDEPFEFIFVVESWRTSVVRPLDPLREAGEPIRVLEVGHTAPEATLIEVAASHARYPLVAVLPPYPRIVAEGLPVLVDAVERRLDLATARREPRRDHVLNRLQTSALRVLLRHAVWVPFRDIGSGVRVMRREVLEEIPLYSDFARFLPALAVRAGFRVEEIPVPQHPDDRGLRVYGLGTYLRRIVDVIGLAFLTRFTRKPLRFFGVVGAVLGAIGGMILVVVAAQRIAGQPLADRPMLLLGVLMLVLGTQSIGLGLIGELIVHFRATETRGYRLAQVRVHPTGRGEESPDGGGRDDDVPDGESSRRYGGG